MEKSYKETTSRGQQRKGNAPGARKGKSTPVTAGMVASMIRSKVQSRNLIEWKYFYNYTTSTNTSFSGSLYPLTDVPQGSADSNRQGDAISLKHLEVNYGIYAATQANAVRVIIFEWKPQVSSGPGLSNILSLTGSAIVPFSTYTIDQHQILSILYDATHSVSPTEPLRLGCFKHEFFNRSIQFSSATTTGTSKLFMYVLSDDGVTPYPTHSFVSKIVFTDA
jgi:glycosidase